MTATIGLEDISVLDRQIDQLMDYKPIPEHEVKALCDKVSFLSYPFFKFPSFNFPSLIIIYRLRKFSQKRATSNQ